MLGRRVVLRQALGLLLSAAIAGCATVPAPPAGSAATSLVRSELFFGHGKPDGSVVTEAEWTAFVDEHVTPRFPDGLTVLEAHGQYRTRAGVLVREPSRVIILFHDGSAASRAAIEEIRTIYRRLFDQESVLLTESPARVSF